VARRESQVLRRLTSARSFATAKEMLREGMSLQAVAQFLHERDFPDVPVGTLRRWVGKYRREHMPPGEVLSPSFIDRMVGRLKDQVNELEEMTRLILYQWQRLNVDAEYETKMKKLLKSQTREVELLFSMLERRARLMMEMGLRPRAPERHIVGVISGEAGELAERGYSLEELLTGLPDEERAGIRQVIQAAYRRLGSGGEQRGPDEAAEE